MISRVTLTGQVVFNRLPARSYKLTKELLLRKLATLTTVLSISTGIVGTTLADASKKPSYYESARRAVCFYFGSNCPTAMRIVKCETGGTYWPWVSNGQYLGIFQMGSSERANYGHGNNVWAQAKAAYAYFLDAGFYNAWLKWQPPGCGA